MWRVNKDKIFFYIVYWVSRSTIYCIWTTKKKSSFKQKAPTFFALNKADRFLLLIWFRILLAERLLLTSQKTQPSVHCVLTTDDLLWRPLWSVVGKGKILPTRKCSWNGCFYTTKQIIFNVRSYVTSKFVVTFFWRVLLSF